MKPLRVSDHALLRYIERGYGIDLDAIRAEIAGQVRDAVEAGARRISKNGLTFSIREDERAAGALVVTTIMPEGSPQAATRGGAKARGTSPGAHTPDKSSVGRHNRRVARGLRP